MSDRWDAFAAREPFFAVLTEPRFLREQIEPEGEEEFFATGEAYVSDLYATLLGTVAPQLAPTRILEYGCGIGRLLIPFARRSESVTGVDISPAMLAHARQQLERAGVRNAELLTAEEFESAPRTFDVVNCFLVLQRLRRDEGMALLERLTSAVRIGGVGVFHLPFRSRASRLQRVTRATRESLPGVNPLINIALRKPPSTPLIPSHTYDMNEVLALLEDRGFESPHLVFSRQGDLDGVIIHARRRRVAGESELLRPEAKPEPEPEPEQTTGHPATHDPAYIDVRRLIGQTSIEELNLTAEKYFQSLDSWDHHLAKPFAQAGEAPQLLISLGTLLQGLDLIPGMTVLEFGAGTGWLSRYLSQLGCRMIVLDVSETALRIARELYQRQPVIGERPEPQFLQFDGRHIDLPDASVERIICFDAFHHAPNPYDVLAEFGRVLKAGGVAAFAEPGPEHSKAPQSQYEMRTYRVIENDVDIHEIARASERLGFATLRLAAFNIPPFHVSLPEYDDLLAGGNTAVRWMESTRGFLRDVRLFFLTKAGTEELDSRRTAGLDCAITARAGTATASEPIPLTLTVRNTGRARWLPSGEPFGGVWIGVRLYDREGSMINREYGGIAIPTPLGPGEETSFDATVAPLAQGQYVMEIDCVAQQVAWFSQIGSTPARVEVQVE
jgi:SAM-dependent methyltransferase